MSESSEPSFRTLLLEELSEWLPEAALSPLLPPEPEAAPFLLVDRAVRCVLPLGLEASGLDAAAAAVRGFPEVVDGEAARRTLFALEKMARAHAAPELLVRAAHGTCACALSLALTAGRGEEAVRRPTAQLVSALVSLVTCTTKTGVPSETVVRALTLAAGPSTRGRPER